MLVTGLDNLAPLGLLKKALELYELQTIEFVRDGAISESTIKKVYEFNSFCIANNSQSLVIVPLIPLF